MSHIMRMNESSWFSKWRFIFPNRSSPAPLTTLVVCLINCTSPSQLKVPARTRAGFTLVSEVINCRKDTSCMIQLSTSTVWHWGYWHIYSRPRHPPRSWHTSTLSASLTTCHSIDRLRLPLLISSRGTTVTCEPSFSSHVCARSLTLIVNLPNSPKWMVNLSNSPFCFGGLPRGYFFWCDNDAARSASLVSCVVAAISDESCQSAILHHRAQDLHTLSHVSTYTSHVSTYMSLVSIYTRHFSIIKLYTSTATWSHVFTYTSHVAYMYLKVLWNEPYILRKDTYIRSKALYNIKKALCTAW